MTNKSNVQQVRWSMLSIAALLFGTGKTAMTQTNGTRGVKNIVFVYGGFVDGSGWEGVYKALTKNG